MASSSGDEPPLEWSSQLPPSRPSTSSLQQPQSPEYPYYRSYSAYQAPSSSSQWRPGHDTAVGAPDGFIHYVPTTFQPSLPLSANPPQGSQYAQHVYDAHSYPSDAAQYNAHASNSLPQHVSGSFATMYPPYPQDQPSTLQPSYPESSSQSTPLPSNQAPPSTPNSQQGVARDPQTQTQASPRPNEGQRPTSSPGPAIDYEQLLGFYQRLGDGMPSPEMWEANDSRAGFSAASLAELVTTAVDGLRTLDPTNQVTIDIPAGSPTRHHSSPLRIAMLEAEANCGTVPKKRSGTQKCMSCDAIATPEWRKGPYGPRTLCNACGLVWAKMIRKRTRPSQSGPDAPLAGSSSPPQPEASSSHAQSQPDPSSSPTTSPTKRKYTRGGRPPRGRRRGGGNSGTG